MTAAEAAARLDLSPGHVIRLARTGVIAGTQLPAANGQGRWLFDPAVIDEYKAERGGAKRVVRSES